MLRTRDITATIWQCLKPANAALLIALLAGCQAKTANTDPASAYRVEFVNEICAGKKAEEQQIVNNIERARACTTDTDCKIVGFGCPFGCAHSINQANEAELRTQISQFNTSDCPSCTYRCSNNQQVPRCVAGTCSARDQSSDDLMPPSA